MATTYTLPIGQPVTLEQNQIYAMPARKVTVYSSLALEGSNTTAFAATPQAITANTPTTGSFMYIRCTAGAAVVKLAAD